MREELYFKTDTLPDEIPVLFTNKNLYQHFNKNQINILNSKDESLEKLSGLSTVPYYFYISKNDHTKRKMSLLHPISQILMFNYILRYEQLIATFSNESKFSVRSPIVKNIPIYRTSDKDKLLDRLEQEFSFSRDTYITSEEDEKFFYSYFSYKPFANITDLYKSPKFTRSKYKYKYFVKLDIQNFFPSIYTHSLAWGIFGDKSLAKTYRSNKTLFGNATDIICQKINFNETNGIVVGPEFSRIIAELLLTSTDKNLFFNLDNIGIKHKEDYLIFRYLDDYFLFTHTKENALKIEETLAAELDKFNLKLNSSKRNVQEKPFDITNHGIVELKNAFTIFNYNKALFEERNATKNNTFEYEIKNQENPFFSKWMNNIWSDLYNNIELIAINNPNDKVPLIKYYLKKIRNYIPTNTINIYNLIYIIEINSNIYSLSINTSSTNALILIYTKVIQNLKSKLTNKRNLLDNSLKKIEIINCSMDVTFESLENEMQVLEELDREVEQLNIEIQKKENYLEKISEKIYQNIFSLLNDNFNDLNEMYELIVFLKSLDRRLPSTFLIKIIQHYSKNYFILCSVAYYILNDSNEKVNEQYKTVIKVLWSNIQNYEKRYISKGTNSKSLDAEYFYIINDFSYYPGFNDIQRSDLRQAIEADWKILNNNFISIFKKLASSSYYDWNKKIENFLREIAKKSIIAPSSKKGSYGN